MKALEIGDKETKDHWSDCGQVFFCDGIARAVDADLRTIPLGKEGIINSALKTNTIPEGLMPQQREVLEWIINFRKEKGYGEQDKQTDIVTPRSPVGSRPLRTVQHREAHPRQPASKQRFPLHKTKRKK